MAFTKRRLTVKNVQKYRIGRAGYIFQPGRERTVTVSTRQQYREIGACVYLHVLADEEAPAAVTKPELPASVTKAAEDAKIVDLRALADEYKVSKQGSKVEIASRLIEAGWEPETGDDSEDGEDEGDDADDEPEVIAQLPAEDAEAGRSAS